MTETNTTDGSRRSAIGVIGAISATVDSAASILKGIKEISEVLNTPRSVVLVVENHTKIRLTRIWDHHKHGGFAVTPSSAIEPQSANIYGSQKKGGAIATGTSGAVIYRLEGENGLGNQDLAIYIHWSNPYLGKNKCGISLVSLLGLTNETNQMPIFAPYIEDKFEAVATCGAGNQEVEMRFELHEGN